MSVPVLSRSLVACRTALAGTADAFHGLRRRRSDVAPRPPVGGRDSASPGRQRPLRTTARQTRPLEPILFPKLRIYFADFPYLHCSIDQRLFTLETCCGYRYDRTRQWHVSLGFSRGVESAPDSARSALLYRTCGPYLQPIWFQGGSPLRRKDNSSRGPRSRLRVRLRRRIARSREENGPIRVPVREYWPDSLSIDGAVRRRARFRTGLPYLLGSTNPCPTAVHMEPCSTSVFKALVWIFATTTKICTDGRFAGARARGCLTTDAPSYSSARAANADGPVWVRRLSAIHFQG